MMHRVSWCIYLLMLFNAHHFTYEETEKQRNYEAGWGQRRVCTFRSFNSEALSWSDSLPQTSSPPFLQNGGKPGSHFGCTQSQIASPCPVPTPWTLVAITDIEHCVSLTCTMYLCMYTYPQTHQVAHFKYIPSFLCVSHTLIKCFKKMTTSSGRALQGRLCCFFCYDLIAFLTV